LSYSSKECSNFSDVRLRDEDVYIFSKNSEIFMQYFSILIKYHLQIKNKV